MAKLQINEEMQNKYPNLIALILNSSLDDNEKQYWLDLMSIMNTSELLKLTEILQNEKEQMEELEKNYGEFYKIPKRWGY